MTYVLLLMEEILVSPTVMYYWDFSVANNEKSIVQICDLGSPPHPGCNRHHQDDIIVLGTEIPS